MGEYISLAIICQLHLISGWSFFHWLPSKRKVSKVVEVLSWSPSSSLFLQPPRITNNDNQKKSTVPYHLKIYKSFFSQQPRMLVITVPILHEKTEAPRERTWKYVHSKHFVTNHLWWYHQSTLKWKNSKLSSFFKSGCWWLVLRTWQMFVFFFLNAILALFLNYTIYHPSFPE